MELDPPLPASTDRLTPACELAGHYDGWLCDVWGVVHNGIAAFEAAINALCRFRQAGGHVILITNAPRPARAIYPQLEQLGVPRDAFDEIVTSGDVTCALLGAKPEAQLYHIGPPRDHMMLEELPNPLSDEYGARLCLLTGVLDDETETTEDYDDLLARMLERKITVYCANPDLIVQRGERLVICAGALAKRYADMGGEVIIAGKPQAPIYRAAMAKMSELAGRHIPRHRLLAIGDGLMTDIKGAVQNGFDAYFITGGIHTAELGDLDSPEGLMNLHSRLEGQFPGIRLAGICERLRWT